MEDIFKWIDKYGEIVIVSTIVVVIVWVIASKVRITCRQMSIAMKLPNISGRGMNKYPEHNQNHVEHGDK